MFPSLRKSQGVLELALGQQQGLRPNNVFLSFFLFPFGCARFQLWHVGSSSLTRDGSPGSLHWEHDLLITGPPGKSPNDIFLIINHNITVCEKIHSWPEVSKVLEWKRIHLLYVSHCLSHKRYSVNQPVKYMALRELIC